jgi:hypothetical protein
MFVSTKCWRMRGSISLLLWPGKVCSSWLLPDLADVLLLLPEGAVLLGAVAQWLWVCAAYIGAQRHVPSRLVVPVRHARNPKNIGINKITAAAKNSLFFTELLQSISLLTGVQSMFGADQTEWGHLTNPQLAQHPYRQEPVAIRAVTLHFSHPSAGI